MVAAPSTAYDAFRVRLRVLRIEQGLTQTQLADLLDVSFSTISEIERGSRSGVPSRDFVLALVSALNDRDRTLLATAGYTPQPDTSRLPEDLQSEVQEMFLRWYSELQETLDKYGARE